MRLLRHGTEASSFFDLLGQGEDDMTAGLGFVLANVPSFAARFAELLCGARPPADALDRGEVRLQTTRDGKGRTDIELDVPGHLLAVVEAKVGTAMPSDAQLRQYVPVLKSSSAVSRLLVALTNAPPEFARSALPSELDAVPTRHLSWREVRGIATASRDGSSHAEKRLLDDFESYLGEVLRMETHYSNMVYVVSLGGGNPEGWSISWIDIVEKRHRYFYWVGKGWPEPPNYIGFRYDGHLQSIHHVEGYELFTDPATIFPEAPHAEWDESYCFKLGPPIRPDHPVPSGPSVQRATRCYAMLDLLLTANSITEAMEMTKVRTGEPLVLREPRLCAEPEPVTVRSGQRRSTRPNARP